MDGLGCSGLNRKATPRNVLFWNLNYWDALDALTVASKPEAHFKNLNSALSLSHTFA